MLYLIKFNDECYLEELGEYPSIQELKEDLLASYDAEDLERITVYEVGKAYHVDVHYTIDIQEGIKNE